MKRVLPLCLAALTLAGCKSRPLSVCVSPRVTGRVLAADTRQPLGDVRVIRNEAMGTSHSTSPAKGGEALQSRAVVRTDVNGRFVLDAERALTPFSGPGWISMTLLFERTGYARFQTNYTYLNLSTNSWEGKPALSAGDVLLQPARK
jgi:hypothetical protein